MRQLQTAGFFVGLSLLLAPLCAHWQTASTVFERVKDSVFVVKVLDAQGAQQALGSAVLLPSGKFVTNYHVVKDGTRYQVGRGEGFVAATYFAGDSGKDICLLDAPGIAGKPAVLGSAASLKVGQPVYAVGSPQGLELSISEGIVSQLRGAPPPMIQTTAAISHGSSGGGLFDSEGRLVGLTVLYIEGGQNLNFALPSEWIAEVKPGVDTSAKERSEGAWWRQVVELQDRADWAGLRDWCLDWTRNEPRNASAWGNLGMAYINLKRYNEAIDACRQALRLNPEFAEVWSNLGGTYSDLKRPRDAIEAYRQALRINPEHAATWYNLGVAYDDLQQPGDAIGAYRQALRVDPKDASAWTNLGSCYNDLNRPEDAIEAERQALLINPKDDNAWVNLGSAYYSLKRFAEATDASLQALRINPENFFAWLNLGSNYYILKRPSEAIDAYRQALRINSEASVAWFYLGLAYLSADNKSAALDVAKTLRRLDPKMSDALFDRIARR